MYVQVVSTREEDRIKDADWMNLPARPPIMRISEGCQIIIPAWVQTSPAKRAKPPRPSSHRLSEGARCRQERVSLAVIYGEHIRNDGSHATCREHAEVDRNSRRNRSRRRWLSLTVLTYWWINIGEENTGCFSPIARDTCWLVWRLDVGKHPAPHKS